MTNIIFNNGLGSIAERVNQSGTLKMLLLKGKAADAVLKDLSTVADLVGEASTTEADFTSYARQSLAGMTVTVDDTNDQIIVDCNDVVFLNAGGTTDNTIVACVIYEEITNDADSILLTKHDVSFTTNGNTVTLPTGSNGFYRSS